MASSSWIQALAGKRAWACMALFGAVLIGFQYYLLFNRTAARVSVAAAPAIDLPLPDFQLTERNGQPLGKADLAGHPWIANFIFTSCPGPCLDMTRAMLRLQKELLPEFPGVRLVSFSIDPETDTPAVLSAFASSYGADPARWLFLTGPRETLAALCQKGFNLVLADADEGQRATTGRFIHSTKFVLVDGRGHIRGYADGLSPDAPGALRAQLRALEAP
jgi:protein SCO1/2